MKRFIILLISISFWQISFAQIPATQENKAGFRSEVFGGLILHTNGWGGNFTYSKFKTYKTYNLYCLDFVNIKDPKEYRIRYQVAPGSFTSSFKYGKVNSLYNLRLSFGKQRMLYEKQREKGVEIYFVWKAGLNTGIVKPKYLEIQNTEGVNTTSQERYDPDIHNESNIFGRASLGKGLGESKIALGGNINAGFKFEIARDRENIFAIETGIVVDVFPTRVPILAYADKELLFYNFYINILFGKKYYN
jgi:hypothetical protein